MKKITALLAGAVALAGVGSTAVAANAREHVLKVALPDGSVEQIHYSGEVAPRIVVLPARVVPVTPIALFDPAPFAMFDRIAAEMDRQTDAMLRQAAMMAAQPATADGKIDTAAFAGSPAGTVHYSFVSTSTSDGTCSRSIQVTSYGPGQQPKTVSQSSGNCADGGKVVPAATPSTAAVPQVTPAKLDVPAARPVHDGPTI
jgi:hypothetical protein